ncbi:peptide chain release factor N(5)-glutamine methyltransferase [candidate division KSB1 bacterium]
MFNTIQLSAEYLKKNGIDNPRTSAEILLGYVLNMKRIDLYLYYDKILSKNHISQYKKVIEKRANKEPLQYITGSTEFMSLPFIVNPAVFIPRPETELLVEIVIEETKKKWNDEEKITILDIGTGSGNIAVSLTHYIKNAEVTTIDISDDTLKTAKENALLNNVADRIKFKNLSIVDADKNEFKDVSIIVSNPPYIPLEDYTNLPAEVKDYEPERSLHDNSDGLTFFRIILEKSRNYLADGGMLFMEMGMGESKDVRAIAESRRFSNITIIKDYQQIDRIIFCEKKTVK